MLICQVADSNVEDTKSGDYHSSDNNANDYQTADDIFRIMTKDEFHNRGDYPHGDLVLLYKNIDLNIQEVENHVARQKSNQRVETIVHNDDPDSDSEISEVNSAEDLHNVFMANKERIDFFNNTTLDNKLCHKHAITEIQSTFTKDRHIAFRDPYITQQLKNFTLECETPENAILPATLLDYICCKRLEDNYNFYMDNIIRYVQHTIEQLKRISNGDYLTEKAKEKWRNVDDTTDDENKNMKVLATSTSIPLRVERKTSGSVSNWDDIVQSEVDIRSLSKILEKRIIIEIPKIISGSYQIFSKNCSSNLVISCKKQTQSLENETVESRLDVVLKLERSESGQVVSNISSIMVLQTSKSPDLLALTYKKHSKEETSVANCDKIVELDHTSQKYSELESYEEAIEDNNISEDLSNTTRFETETTETSDTVSIYGSLTQSVSDVSYSKLSTSAEYLQNCLIPDDLMVSMRKFQIQTLPEEVGEDFPSDVNPKNPTKKRSPTRVRIKSPYENKSYVLEEKKRKRLLEIREKRERRKVALGEACKISKQKYGKGGIMPQPSNSVTKLSITNKSFYNSIYGHAMVLENNQKKGKPFKLSPNNSIPKLDEDQENLLDSDRSNKKFTNRCFYLDETETEMMYVDAKTKEENDIDSVDIPIGLSNFTSYDIKSNVSCSSIPEATETSNNNFVNNLNEYTCSLIKDESCKPEKVMKSPNNQVNSVPTNSPNNTNERNIVVNIKKSSPSLECRKSIDEIYNLIPNLNKNKESKKIDLTQNCISESSTFQESDSGTSLKHQFTSSNPSSYGFPKNEIDHEEKTQLSKKSEAIIPRVVINSKSQLTKQDNDKSKKNKKVVPNPVSRVTDNPLKAISQLLHEIENIQIINKEKTESKVKKQESGTGKNLRQNIHKGKLQVDQHLKEPQLQNINEKSPKIPIPVTTTRRLKPLIENSRNHPQSPVIEKVKIEDKVKRKLVDIIDEAKEARGEAVRGPSKFNSRLNTLAQPKKSYVQAHNEEYYSKYGRNLVADKLQRLNMTPVANKERTLSANSRNKSRYSNTEGTLSTSTKAPSSVLPLDRNVRARRSTSCSPENKALRQNIPSQNVHVSQATKVIKKMGDVESYVNTHFGNDSKNIIGKAIPVEQRSRVPLVPKDIDLDSLSSMNSIEESSKLGSKLHYIIDNMLGNPPPALSVLSEGLETNFMSKSDIISYNENKGVVDEKTSIGSDYPIGVIEDVNIVTAVENQEKKDITDAFYAIQSVDSVTEVDLLEKVLCKQICNGTFKKNLRLKKLTISPKQSLKQMILLQSGDSGSLGAKSLLSQSLQTKGIEETKELTLESMLSKLQIDWDRFRLSTKVMTVAYTFPVVKKQLSSSILNTQNYSKDHSKTLQIKGQAIRLKAQPFKVLHSSGHHTSENLFSSEYNFVEKNSSEFGQLSTEEYLDSSNEKRHDYNSIQKLTDKTTMNVNLDKSLETINGEVKNSEISKNKITKAENVVNTSSLDILVGLLNEIQKISECQTNMTKDHRKHELNVEKTQQQTKKPLDFKKCCNKNTSLTRFLNPKDAKSQPSIYTFYVNSFKEDHDNIDYCFMPGSTTKFPKNDKSVLVSLPGYQTNSRFTECPSIFSLSADHGTVITESLVEMLNKSSNQSLIPLRDARNHCYISEIQESKRLKNIASRVVKSKNEDCKLTSIFSIKPKRKAGEKIQEAELLTENAMMEYDPLIKMKKDILVTVYSILVFTVFAALSLPDVFNEY